MLERRGMGGTAEKERQKILPGNNLECSDESGNSLLQFHKSKKIIVPIFRSLYTHSGSLQRFSFRM